MWLTWSTVFVAQGLNKWIQDFEEATNPGMQEERMECEDELYASRRDYFAGELLVRMSHLGDIQE